MLTLIIIALHLVFVGLILGCLFFAYMNFTAPNPKLTDRIEGAKFVGALLVISLFYVLFIQYRNSAPNLNPRETTSALSDQREANVAVKNECARVGNTEALVWPSSAASSETGNEWIKKSDVDKLETMSHVILRMRAKGCNVNFDANYYVRQLNDFFATIETRSVEISKAFALIATGAGENFACPRT